MTKIEEFTLSLTSDELDWLFEEVFPEAIEDVHVLGEVTDWGFEAIGIKNKWEAQVKAQGYGKEKSNDRDIDVVSTVVA